MESTETIELSRDLVDSAVGLRDAVVAVLSEIGTLDARPMDLSKRLGVDKSLSWKLARLGQSTEPAAIMEQVPGTSAFAIFLRALTRVGASERNIQTASLAHDHFEEMVEKHVGDRATLELVIDSLAGKRRGKLDTSRKLAFRGNSGIWGVQARTRVNLGVIFPNAADPDFCDSALVGGWVDFRRLRNDARWVMFRRAAWTGDDANAPSRLRNETIAPEMDPSELGLFKAFCSPNMPEVNSALDERDKRVLLYELGKSPIGNTGAFNCYFGTVARKIGPRTGDSPDSTATIGAQISAPVENLLFDLLVHKAARLTEPPVVRVYGTLSTMFTPVGERDLLPVESTIRALSPTRDDLTSDLASDYADVAEFAVSRLGFQLDDFLVYRYELAYPPFPSTVLMSLPLPPSPPTPVA